MPPTPVWRYHVQEVSHYAAHACGYSVLPTGYIEPRHADCPGSVDPQATVCVCPDDHRAGGWVSNPERPQPFGSIRPYRQRRQMGRQREEPPGARLAGMEDGMEGDEGEEGEEELLWEEDEREGMRDTWRDTEPISPISPTAGHSTGAAPSRAPPEHLDAGFEEDFGEGFDRLDDDRDAGFLWDVDYAEDAPPPPHARYDAASHRGTLGGSSSSRPQQQPQWEQP